MTCTPFNIKVVEGNDFALLLPLKKRTYVSNVPIDEDIDATELQNVVFKIGAQEYTPELGTDGVRVVVTDKPTRGTYDIVLTATYHGSAIVAGYFEALTIVAWNYQSDAEQYVQGSPIEMQSAYVIGGTLTDAELVALKQQYIAAKEAMQQAQAAAEASKAAYDAKAEMLNDVAQETTSQAILNAIGRIDFSELAKQGSNPNATNTAILAAFGQIDFSQLAKQGTDASVTLTGVYNKLDDIGGLVLMTEAEKAPALEDLDEMLDEIGNE